MLYTLYQVFQDLQGVKKGSLTVIAYCSVSFNKMCLFEVSSLFAFLSQEYYVTSEFSSTLLEELTVSSIFNKVSPFSSWFPISKKSLQITPHMCKRGVSSSLASLFWGLVVALMLFLSEALHFTKQFINHLWFIYWTDVIIHMIVSITCLLYTSRCV